MVFELIIGRGDIVGKRLFANHAAGKLAGQRMRGQNSLGSIGQGLAWAIDSLVIGWDEPIAFRQASSHCQTGDAGAGSKAGSNEFAPGHRRHRFSSACTKACSSTRSGATTGPPVIIARIRLPKPAITTMMTWTTTKSSRNTETKKFSVRADCRPPRTSTATGTEESKAGERAR